MFEKGFRASKCKSLLNSVISRISQARNKRGAHIRQSRKDVAQLLQSGQDASARKRVDIVMREQNILDAYALLEKFCELVLARLSVIKAEKNCPLDIQEAISSLIFVGPRCADLPELLELRSIFEEHYGKKFVVAAAELQSGCGVNKVIIEKLSGHTAYEGVRVQLMKEIAAENRVHWSPKDSDIVSQSQAELKSAQTEKKVPFKELAGKTSISIQDKVSDDSVIPTSSKGQADSSSSLTSNIDQGQFVPFLPSLPRKSPPPRSTDSLPSPTASLDKEQFIPFVPSSSRKSSPPSDSVEEQTQFISFLPSAPKKSLPSHRTLEVRTSDEGKDAGNLYKQKSGQYAHALRGERDNELLANKFSKKNEQEIDFIMGTRNGLSKDIHGAISTKEDSSTLPGQKLINQQGKGFSNGDEAETDIWKQSNKQMSTKPTNVLSQRDVEHDIELHASQPLRSRLKANSRGRVVNDNMVRSSDNADDLPSPKQQSKIEWTEAGFQENGLQLRRSKHKAEFMRNLNNMENANRSVEYEDELAKHEEGERIRGSVLSKYSKHQESHTRLQNRRKQSIRHSSADTSSESDDNDMLDQRPSTNAERMAFSNITRSEQESSSEDEFNIETSAVREPRPGLHAHMSVVAHKGNDFGNPVNGEFQDLSHAHRVHGSEKTHLSKQETGSSIIIDTEKSSLNTLQKGACVSSKSSISGGWSAKGSVEDKFLYFKRDDGQHFDKVNMHNLSKQNPRMRREKGVLAEEIRLDFKNNFQTKISTQDGIQNDVGERHSSSSDSSTTEKDKQLQVKTKHPGQKGFVAGVHDVSANSRGVHGKLGWRSSHQEEEDSSLSSSGFQPPNVSGVHLEADEVYSSANSRGVHGKLGWRSSHQEEEDISLSSSGFQPPNVSGVHLEAEEVYSQTSDQTVKQLPHRKIGSTNAENHHFVDPSLTRSKRTTGVSVRSQRLAKAAEGSKPELAGKEGSTACNQSVEASRSIYPDINSVRNVHSEFSTEASASECSSSKPIPVSYLHMSRPSNDTSNSASWESKNAQKVLRVPYSRSTPAAEIISAQQNSSRRTSVAYLPTYRPRDGEKPPTVIETNYAQKFERNPSPLTRIEVEKSSVQDASSRKISASYLPTSAKGSDESPARNKALHPSSQPQHTLSNTKHPSSKLTSSSNLPCPVSTKAQKSLYSDDDLLSRFQALKANLY